MLLLIVGALLDPAAPLVTAPPAVYTQARSAIARAGATRAGYFVPNPIVVIGNSTRTTSVISQSLRVSLSVNDQPSTATFTLKPGSALPALFAPVVIALGSTATYDQYLFSGAVVAAEYRRLTSASDPFIDVQCVDYSRWLNRRLITRIWLGESISNIVTDIIGRYTSGFNADAVQASAVILDRFVAQDETASQLLTRLVRLNNGGGWFIRYPVVHFFGPGGETGTDVPTAPRPLTLSLATLKAFAHRAEGRELRTRVTVEGGSTTIMIPIPAGTTPALFGIPVEHDWLFNTALDPGNALRIGNQTATYILGRTVRPLGPPYCTLTVAATAGDTSITIDDNAALVAYGSDGWLVDDGGNYFAFFGMHSGAPTSVGLIPPVGNYGDIKVDLPIGMRLYLSAAILNVIPTTVSGLWDEAIEPGEEVFVRVVKNDAIAQAAVAGIEGGDGIYEHVVTSNSTSVGFIQADALALAELAAFASETGVPSITWTTTDMHARPGAQQVIAITGTDDVFDTVTITSVDLSFPVPNKPPIRECQGAKVKLQQLIDVLTHGA